MHGLIREAPDATIHLTLNAKRRTTDAITFHRGKLLRREVRTLHGDIRATSAARTIADIGHDLDDEDLERIVADAIRRRLTTERELTTYATSRRGAAKLRRVLQLDGGPEIDGFGFHGDRVAFEADRARDAERASRGWMTVRFTWRQIRDDRMAVAAELAAALSLRGS